MTRATPQDDLGYQWHALRAVSRTYALTIPVLPDGLRDVVGNAYLLCRIADIVEDEPGLPHQRKQELWDRFLEVVGGGAGAADFARDLSDSLTPATPEAEQELAAGAERILRVTARFPSAQRAAIERCLGAMCRGMVEFQQEEASLAGLRDLRHLDRYCHVAAGVVGELMLELCCGYSAEIARRREELQGLVRSHAQGLQMANILKDIWEDREQGRCWLPRDVFESAGFDPGRLSPDIDDPGFAEGLSRLVAITRNHLEDALRFTLLIPAREAGIRRHLLWAIALALLALRRVHRSRSFRRGRNIRFSRFQVGAAILLTSALVRSDTALGLAFRAATRTLPRI